MLWPQPKDRCRRPLGLGVGHHPKIDLGPGLRGNDVCTRAAAYDADVDRRAISAIRLRTQSQQQPSQLFDGAYTGERVRAGVSRATGYLEVEHANPFPGGFEGSRLAGLEDQATAARRASASMSAREVGLPSSSSELISRIKAGIARASSRRACRAQRACT